MDAPDYAGKNSEPTLGEGVFIAPSAYVAGDVKIGPESTIMYNVIIRGDIAPIRIGSQVNIQDGSVVHTPYGVPLDMADRIGVGHRAIIHCRRIGPRTLIGMGAILLDDCEIGQECLIAAGSVLPPGMHVPDGSVVMGVPARVVRSVTPRDLEAIDHVVSSYRRLGPLHAAGRFPNIVSRKPNEFPS